MRFFILVLYFNESVSSIYICIYTCVHMTLTEIIIIWLTLFELIFMVCVIDKSNYECWYTYELFLIESFSQVKYLNRNRRNQIKHSFFLSSEITEELIRNNWVCDTTWYLSLSFIFFPDIIRSVCTWLNNGTCGQHIPYRGVRGRSKIKPFY